MIKGLVMGGVQSGKTANMIGVMAMAAHYDWNVFIILSGTIDNLRKQTRDRVFTDLNGTGGVRWHLLEQTSNPSRMRDMMDEDNKIFHCLFYLYQLRIPLGILQRFRLLEMLQYLAG